MLLILSQISEIVFCDVSYTFPNITQPSQCQDQTIHFNIKRNEKNMNTHSANDLVEKHSNQDLIEVLKNLVLFYFQDQKSLQEVLGILLLYVL